MPGCFHPGDEVMQRALTQVHGDANDLVGIGMDLCDASLHDDDGDDVVPITCAVSHAQDATQCLPSAGTQR